MKKISIVVILLVLTAMINASAYTVSLHSKTPLFDQTGALIHSGTSGLKGSSDKPEFGNTRDITPWNLWTNIGDGTYDQYDNPKLEIDANGMLRALFCGHEEFYWSRNILFAESGDFNVSWTNPNIVAAHTTTNLHFMYPEFAKSTETDVWAAFSQYHDGFDGVGVKFIRSHDGGATFDAPVIVDDGDPASNYRLFPNALTYQNHVLVVWAEWADTVGFIRWSRSDDNGATFLAEDQPIDDSFAATSTHDQAVTVFNPLIERWFVVWATADEKIVIAWSDDFGDTWTTPMQINDLNNVYAEEPDMIIGPDGTLYVVWADIRNGDDLDVFFVKSEDNGATWTNPSIKVNDDIVAGNQYEPHIFLDSGGVLHTAFNRNMPGSTMVDLYYTYSTDGGASWVTPNLIVNDEAGIVGVDVPCTFDVVADADHAAYIAWRDFRDWPQIICTSNKTENPPTPTAPPPTETPTPVPTETPTPIETATPSPVPTDTPDITPTTTPDITELGVDLQLSQDIFHSGDRFLLQAILSNPGPDEPADVPFVVLLDVFSDYFWYPGWTSEFQFEPVDLNIGRQDKSILDFTWPEVDGSAEGLLFYGAFLNNSFTEIVGNWDYVSFGWE